jgi:hypothetical protein
MIWYNTHMSGYSPKYLSLKLGFKPNHVITLVHHPEDYGHLLHPIPEGCSIYDELKEPSDIIQFFAKSTDDLEKHFQEMQDNLKKDGALWISWPKKSSKVPTDLDENKIRDIGLRHGLVDVKVIAIDDVWSGLKFVYRTKDR